MHTPNAYILTFEIYQILLAFITCINSAGHLLY
uniref:Uncharacterized protein n=1 Tax=Rhizophora mucronata TaxID=61149 RepID=A0A2P2NRU4_RHIMU